MRLKLLPRRPVRDGYIKLNRSDKLEKKPGYYDGRAVTNNCLYLPAIIKGRA